MSPTAVLDELMASDVVGDWQTPDGVVFMCPGGPVPPDECDCGYVGNWESRWVYVWYEHPGHSRHARNDEAILRDVREGRPPRPDDEGWWVMGGRDQRCPACGDVERYDNEGECVAVNLNRAGRIKRASQLREFAEAMEHEAWRTPQQVDQPASGSHSSSIDRPEVGK